MRCPQISGDSARALPGPEAIGPFPAEMEEIMSKPMRIHVAINADEFAMMFSPASIERLHRLGEVEYSTASGSVPLPPHVADLHDVLVTSWCTQPFDEERLTGSRLRLAIHTAGSIRTLFPRSVLENGIQVVQAGADAMAPPVAEMALTLTLALLRNLHTHDRGLQTTRDWLQGGAGMLGNGIQEQQIGVVGLSRTGRHYVSMLHGLGVRCIRAYDPYVSAAEAAGLGVELVALNDVCATSDVLAIHAPVTPETRHLIGATELALLRTGGILINTARSALVDQDALLQEVVAGRIRAGLDVFDDEPLPPTSAFFGLPNVLLTPHIAGGTVEGRLVQGATVVDEIERFMMGQPLQHEVLVENYDRLS